MASIFRKITGIFKKENKKTTPKTHITLPKSKPKQTSQKFDIREFIERGGTQIARTPQEARDIFERTEVGRAIRRSRGGGGSSAAPMSVAPSTISKSSSVTPMSVAPEVIAPKPTSRFRQEQKKEKELRLKPVSVVREADIPTSFFAQQQAKIEEERRRLRTKKLRGKKLFPLEEAKLTTLGAVSAAGGTALTLINLKDMPKAILNKLKKVVKGEDKISISPKEVLKTIKKGGKTIKKGGKNFGRILKVSPGEALAQVGTEILIFGGSGKTIKVIGKLGSKAKKFVTPIIKQKGTKVIFKGTQAQKGNKIVTKIIFKAGRGAKKAKFKKSGKAVGITTVKGKKSVTITAGDIGKLKKGKVTKKTQFVSGELTKAQATKLKSLKEVVIKKRQKAKKLREVSKKKAAILRKRRSKKLKKQRIIAQRQLLKRTEKARRIRNLDLELGKIRKQLSVTFSSDSAKALKKAKKKILKTSSKSRRKAIIKNTIKDIKRNFETKAKGIKKQLLKESEKARKRGIVKLEIKKARAMVTKALTRNTKQTLARARKNLLKENEKIRKRGVLKQKIQELKKKFKPKITLRKAKKRILRKSEAARRRGAFTFEIEKAKKLTKVPSKKITAIKKNIQSLRQVSVGQIKQARDIDKLRRSLKKARVKGVDTKKFASVSNVFTNKDLSMIVGKTITNKKDLIKFIGTIRGTSSLNVGSLSLKQQKVFKKALQQVLGAVTASTTKSKKILPKLSPKAKATLARINPEIAKIIPLTMVKAPRVRRLAQKQAQRPSQRSTQVAKQKSTSKARTKTAQKEAQATRQRSRQRQKTKQVQRQKQLQRQKTRLKQKQSVRQRQRLKQRQRLRLKQTLKRPTITRPSVGFTVPRVPKIILPKLKKKKKVVRKAKPKKGFNVFVKSKKKSIKVNTRPLSKSKAKDRGAFFTDRTVSNTFKIVPTGKVKKLGKLTKGESGYFSKTRKKFRSFRIKKKRRIGITNKFIEKKGKPRIDTKGEKRGLTVARLLKRKGIKRKRKSIKNKVVQSKKSKRK